jgi:hypothetical protein
MKCSDGRTIRPGAFKHCDGQEVPLVWNHQHNGPENVLGKALLHNRDEGVYAYCTFNDTDSGQAAKKLVEHGDVKALSIYANQLKQQGGDVLHGAIRELSLVLAGANPGAFIDSIIKHGDDSDEEAIIKYIGEDTTLFHGDDIPEEEESKEVLVEDEIEQDVEPESEVEPEVKPEEVETPVVEEVNEDEPLAHADESKESSKEEPKVADEKKTPENNSEEKTVKDVFDTFTEEQKTVVYALIGQALEDAGVEDDDDDEVKHSEGGNDTMSHNIFENNEQVMPAVLSHADQAEIIKMAKSSGVGSLKAAMEIFANEHADTLAHGIDDIQQLFPDYKDVYPGAPELLERDQSWVGTVLKKVHKSPISRVRTRQADARAKELSAKGYNNREAQKALSGNIKLLMRTTDPQTIYYRDELHRDDVIDITDFDVIAFQKGVMKRNMEEMIALAALVGDGREDTDPDKIHENHVRSVWHDDDLYTIKATLDLEAARKELQGSNTSANFGENYIYAEAFITAALYARENYKGKGAIDFYCDPHLLNVMLLARDLNGRRIYESKADLARVLNVENIHTVEQFAGLTREDAEGNTKKLLGIFVNMGNYQFGCTKGGEITNFEDFDIDFNLYKYLMETRLSGALTMPYSAIAVEELVSEAAAG